MATYHTVAGMTGDQDFQLLENGQPLAATIASLPVELLLWDKYGLPATTLGNVTNRDDGSPETRGVVRVNLDAADLDPKRAPYTGRFKVTDETDKVVFFPSADADKWIVGPGG